MVVYLCQLPLYMNYYSIKLLLILGCYLHLANNLWLQDSGFSIQHVMDVIMGWTVMRGGGEGEGGGVSKFWWWRHGFTHVSPIYLSTRWSLFWLSVSILSIVVDSKWAESNSLKNVIKKMFYYQLFKGLCDLTFGDKWVTD